MQYIWFIVAFFFMLLELGTPSLFYFLSFFVGALVTFMMSPIFTLFREQMGIFCISSILALFILQRWIKKIKTAPAHKTNFFALAGKQGIVTRTIFDTVPGLVKINGEIWTARCIHGSYINEGKKVEVVRVQGAYVIVQEIK